MTVDIPKRVRYLHPDFIEKVLPLMPSASSMYTQNEDKDANMKRMTAGKQRALEQYWSHLKGDVMTKDVKVTMRDGVDVSLRIYTPAKESPHAGKRPPVYNLHGGGFVAGSIATDDLIARQLCAECDAIIYSLEYRLAPDVPVLPTIANDAEDGLKWVFENAAVHGSDASNGIFLCGTSSGGYLQSRNAFRARSLGIDVKGTILRQPAFTLSDHKLLAAFYPDIISKFTSLEENADAPGLTKAKIAQLLDRVRVPAEVHTNTDDFLLFASLEKLAQLPGPIYLVIATCDPVVDEVLYFRDRLAEAGVDVRWKEYKGMPHGFHAYHELQQARDEMGDTATALNAMIQQSREK